VLGAGVPPPPAARRRAPPPPAGRRRGVGSAWREQGRAVGTGEREKMGGREEDAGGGSE